MLTNSSPDEGSSNKNNNDVVRNESTIIDGLEIYNTIDTFEGDDYIPGGPSSDDDSATIISVLPTTTLSAELMASLSTALSMALSLSFLNTKSFPTSSFSLLVLLATCAGVYYEKSHSHRLSQTTNQANLDQEEANRQLLEERQGIIRKFLRGLKGFLNIFWEWCGSIIFHSIILLLHVVLSTHSLNECGVVRTLIVSECGPAATAIIVYCINSMLSSNIFTVSATSHSSSSSSLPSNLESEGNTAGNSSKSRKNGSINTGNDNNYLRRSKVPTMGSFSFIILGFIALIFSDTRSIGGNIALLMFNIINYTRVFFLPNIPPQAYLFPTLISGLILAPWGVPSLLTRKFILLFDIKLLIVLFASFFSRFADYRATYMFKRRHNRTGWVYFAVTHIVIIAGFVFERILAKSHFATIFTFLSATLLILGTSIALDFLPPSATHPRASDEDKNDVIEFIKSRADMLLSYFSHINKKNYRKTISTTIGTFKKFFKQTVESSKSRRLLIYVILSFAFMGVEITYGITKDNLSLISAGTDMFFNSFGLVIGLFASYVSKEAPNRKFTYGYGRAKLLSFFLNGLLLLAVSIMMLIDSIIHVISGVNEAHSPMFVLISIIGLIIHLIGVIFFREYSHSIKKIMRCDGSGAGSGEDSSNEDINLGGIFIHVMVDTMSSLGLLISTICVQVYDYDICDPICSIAISVMTFRTVLPQMRRTLDILLQKSTFPEDTINAFQSRITELARNESPDAVCTSFHVWTHTPGYIVATVKLKISQDANEQHILTSVSSFLKSKGVTSPCVECIKNTVKPTPNLPCLSISNDSNEISN